MVTKVACSGRSAKIPTFFFLESLDATATDRFDHTSTWRGGGRKGFFFSCFFFLLSGVSFFFCSAELPVYHCILSMHCSFLKKNKQLAELSHVSPSFGTPVRFSFFFFCTPAGATRFFFFPLVLPSFVFEVGGKGRKNQKLPQPYLVQPKPRSLSHKQPKQISPKTL